MNLLTINELSRKTGISSYEIRRRVHNGTLPHMRVGAKGTKILIDEDVFRQLVAEESINNAAGNSTINAIAHDTYDTIGYGRLRKID